MSYALQREFVCVRLVQMKGVDLRTFQFDWDLTWHTFFLNADGTIYGRYGTRAGVRNNQLTHISLASFKKALQRALELPRSYPAIKATLGGKRGPEPEYQFAEACWSNDRQQLHSLPHGRRKFRSRPRKLKANSPRRTSGPFHCPTTLACAWTKTMTFACER